MRALIYAACFATLASPVAAQTVPKPAALISDGVPEVPQDLAAKSRRYMEFRTASFWGWNAKDNSILIGTRFANSTQIHRVAAPNADRRQLSFEAEPIASASWAPRRADVMVVQKDIGGNEFFQLYTLIDGALRLLTDGKSRNEMNAWSDDGSLIGYSSTRRNGADSDLYVMDPRDPKTDRMVAQVKGGGWAIATFSPDERSAIVANYVSVTNTDLWLLDLASGKMTAIGNHKKDVAFGSVQYGPGGSLWATSDEGGDFQQLGTLDPGSGKFTPRTSEQWDVEIFHASPDRRFLAYTVNEAGVSRLRLLDPRGGTRKIDTLPAGVIDSLEISEQGQIGVALSGARSPSDVYSVDPESLAVTRWTQSESGGLDPLVNAEPRLIETVGFDGLQISGFLFRPDPDKFPGKRPLIMSVHGGPEGQSRPVFLGRTNYLLNELGVAVFFPNVRGSTGYGKRFVSLDNGPFKREDSVKDMAAFLDKLAADPDLDASRFGLTGGSYGGYMCYAAAVQLKDRLRATACVVAISNFVTFLQNTESYRRDLRRVEYGDERDPKQRTKLLAISPLTRVAEIERPMMVITGGNDPRVPASEADQIVKAIRAKGGAAWHLLGTNEGHGFRKKENVDYQFWATMMFWERYLLAK